MIYRQEDAEEMFCLLVQINALGYSELWSEFTSKTLMEIVRNKNADANTRYLERERMNIEQIDPIKMRDTIIELEAYEEHYRHQRDELTATLLAEGFALVKMIDENLDKIDKSLYSNPKLWEVNDLVECVKSAGSLYTTGELYRVYRCNDDDISIRDDDDNLGHPSFCTYSFDTVTTGERGSSSFKFHSRG